MRERIKKIDKRFSCKIQKKEVKPLQLMRWNWMRKRDYGGDIKSLVGPNFGSTRNSLGPRASSIDPFQPLPSPFMNLPIQETCGWWTQLGHLQKSVFTTFHFSAQKRPKRDVYDKVYLKFSVSPTVTYEVNSVPGSYSFSMRGWHHI